MSELQPPGSPPTDPDVASVTATAVEHAATLRATREAHQEAHQLLATAAEARQAATEEAERLVLEARDAAERARQELAGWAAAQRAKVDALTADMVESANRDADNIRAEALRTSMAEAEETSRAYIADAAETARRDGEAIRDEARALLTQATAVGDQVAETIGDLTTKVADIMERLLGARDAMEQLLADNPAPASPDDDFDVDDLDDRDSAEVADVVLLEDTGELDVTLDEDDPSAAAVEDDTDPATDAGSDDGLAAVEPDEEAIWEAAYDDVDETTVPVGDESPDHPRDRQLGSMFRRHGQRGD